MLQITTKIYSLHFLCFLIDLVVYGFYTISYIVSP